ncbi:MAG: preprotein translocase subunit SecA [Myxococcales bacterium]|nr:preprotein translocase subunit SecA [Myxococcales bacterium]MCB9643015.1 preprotein translocase subunit SecA [Myxococcales bacterium]
MSIIKILGSLFGTSSGRKIKKMRPLLTRINSLENDMKALRDEEFVPRMNAYRQRHENGESLDSLLPEVFALTREASVRATGMRHYDVQMIGGITLHQGKIAEMKTGEGKTLVATLPLCLNALSGKGTHLVTVNDYLARRDADWMSKIYRYLGLSVGTITHELSDTQRRRNYACDITYGTNNEFGFDYLRDNMKFGLDEYVQRELNYAIVDEVDSILIDEARTPLIISGTSDDSTEMYFVVDAIMPRLQKGLHFSVDEKSRSVVLTDEGVERVEKLLQVQNLYEPNNILLLHHVTQALRAHAVYKKDVDYMVKSGEVMIIDEFTGRALPGRRWSDGLHQAVEAKEKVKIEPESQTLASISFQNYFRLYSKLAGMTGTAETEAAEFHKTYKLDVTVIPTNKKIARMDYNDVVYRTEREKFEAVIDELEECHKRGQPVLVGTVSIERSEILHKMLTRRKIPHQVLNAKHDEKEAEIVSQAGRKGSITIATNMAGRGTDIILGGNPEPFVESILEQHNVDTGTMESTLFVKEALKGDEKKARTMGKELASISDHDFKRIFERRDEWKREATEVLSAGGLFILGTERHESRRIDNQLRGRSGRQGDPGASRFYLSLEDDLMRRFGSERLSEWMGAMGMQEGEPIEHRMVTRAIESAQNKVEAHNFEIRKHLLEYDDVMDIQRKTIYRLRRELLASEDVHENVLDMIEDVIVVLRNRFCPDKTPVDMWEFEALEENCFGLFHFRPKILLDHLISANDPHEEVENLLWTQVEEQYKQRERELGPKLLRQVERELYLMDIDELWKDHLKAIDHLREGINLQGYRQIDPKLVYKKEAYQMFEELLERIKTAVVEKLFHVEVQSQEQLEEAIEERRRHNEVEMQMEHAGFDGEDGDIGEPDKPATVRRERPKVGRNDPCWCGSGKKYKKCHGKDEKGKSAS